FGHECRADALPDMVVMYAHDDCRAMTTPSCVPEQAVSDNLFIDRRNQNRGFRPERFQPLACRLEALKRSAQSTEPKSRHVLQMGESFRIRSFHCANDEIFRSHYFSGMFSIPH